MKNISIISIIIVSLLAVVGCGGAKDGKPDAETLKQQYITAMKDLSNIGLAIMAYQISNDSCPEVETIAELKKKLVPEFTKDFPLKDPWGKEYLYKRHEKQSFSVGSAGSDGVFDGWDQEGNYFILKGQDVIYKNGKYALAPK